MSTLGYAALDAIAARTHSRVRRTAKLIRGTELDRSCQFQEQALTIECSTEGTILYVEVRGATASVVFAAGRPDSLLAFADQRLDSIEGVAIYARADGRFSPTGWLGLPSNRALLIALLLQPDEDLLVARNAVSAVLLPVSPELSWQRMESLVAIATSLAEHSAAHPDPGEPEMCSPILPQEFSDLTPLANIWAEPDDHTRESLLLAAPAAALTDLIRAVSPHLARIDSLLQNDESPSEALDQLGWLALATAEARLELERRKSQH